ncbi:hypothetical protein [Synechococcus sp. CCY 9618]|uniref:hypothetical protein n=1 Tax=Synechococcus sp. CCY 9618 TaxID=2815602 RepID=UPI001C229AB2|nr:hypothetical protein [Synechococcus sp. CCY 9618]
MPLALQVGPARAEKTDLNPTIEQMCQGMAGLNTKIGATAAPGTPMGKLMETNLSLSVAQYEALWSLMKLTPTTTCQSLY